MLSAKQARQKAEQNRISLTKLSVEKAISKAVEKGKDSVQFSDNVINTELENELKENGYKVTRQAVGVKISW